MTAARRLYAVPAPLADVVPLPQHGGVERSQLAHRVLRLVADGRVARSTTWAGVLTTVSGSSAGTLAGEVDRLVGAGLAQWITYQRGQEIATATLRGRQVLTGWDETNGPGDAA